MARKLKLDFTNVEGFVRCEEGEHIVVLREIKEQPSSNGNDMLAVVFEVVAGDSTGAKLFENFTLTEKALWKFQAYLKVLGIKSDGKVMVDIDKLIGKKCIVTVFHEEYEGKMRAKIDEFKKYSVKDVEEPDDEDFEDDEDEEEEEVKPKKKKAKKKKPAPAPVEDDEEDDEEFEEDEEEEEEEKPKKKKKKAPAKKKKAKKKPEPEEDDDDDDDDWEEA